MFFIVFLGIIQGICEFLPISSSAHLIIFRDIFGIGRELFSPNILLSYDIALHLGTSLAVFFVFSSIIINITCNGIFNGTNNKNGKLFWHLVVSTLPAGIVGILFEDIIEGYIRNKYVLISLSLIIVGIIIYYIDKHSKRDKSLADMTFKDALVIGLFQIFSLIPGFSRSGTTIAIARYLKYDRYDACLYSFYLSLPVVLGAAIFKLIVTDISIITSNILLFAIGTLISFITGVICIKYLLKYIESHNFKVFMIYRILIGIVVLLYLFI